MPPNEKRGRRHSSLVTVVVLREDENEGYSLDTRELRLETYRDSGPGGQHRNRRDTAVRVIHIPTGIIVTNADQRSQYQNKQVALQRMAEILAEQQGDNAHAERNAERNDQFDDRSFTWTDWRDEVKTSGGKKVSMKRALKGDLKKMLA